jgi:dethiobiotin synthetase
VTRFVIVTGTDTGVGKTYVTEALAQLLSRTKRVVAIKPFESGVTDEPGDGERLAAATGQEAPKRALVRLKAPLTPALAADLEGVAIDFDGVVDSIRKHARGADVVLIEGAGGVLSPLTWTHDILHVIELLAARDASKALLVASDRLGTLSATRAAYAVISGRLSAPAILLNAPAASDASTGTNAAALRRLIPGVPLHELAWANAADPTRALAPLAEWLVR